MHIEFFSYYYLAIFKYPLTLLVGLVASQKTKNWCVVVTSPEGGSAPPTICGLNTGQHMFVDSSSSCNKLSFNIGKTFAYL